MLWHSINDSYHTLSLLTRCGTLAARLIKRRLVGGSGSCSSLARTWTSLKRSLDWDYWIKSSEGRNPEERINQSSITRQRGYQNSCSKGWPTDFSHLSSNFSTTIWISRIRIQNGWNLYDSVYKSTDSRSRSMSSWCEWLAELVGRWGRALPPLLLT